MNKTELLLLERSHRFISKTLQGVPKRTRSDKCCSLLGMYSIETEINICKLLFLGRLCRLKSNALPKRILVTRLLENKYRCVDEQFGFVPDILELVRKYNLIKFLSDFLETGIFPSKQIWSRTVKQHVYEIEEDLWHTRMESDNDFNIFRMIHSKITPHKAWIIAKLFPELREKAKFLVDICCLIREDNELLLCDKCGQFYNNIFKHLLLSCDHTRDSRDEFWRDIIAINPITFSV